MEERTVEISANEYRKLIELEGRVNAALIFLDTDEYASRNVLVGILRIILNVILADVSLTRNIGKNVINAIRGSLSE